MRQLLFGLMLVLPTIAFGQNALPEEVTELCQQVDNRLASVTMEMCEDLALDTKLGESVQGRPILARQFEANNDEAIRILFMGGIHGDELSSVSISFIWMDTLRQYHSGTFDWWVIPVLNPDGLLRRGDSGWASTRGNANGVDLNRNFLPSEDEFLSSEYRAEQKRLRPRRYPGPSAVSEPETQIFEQMILDYEPDIIFSIHAPYGIIDFDGSDIPGAPLKFGSLNHRALGTFPGSLGDFAWNRHGIPVVTIELASAGRMPEREEMDQMWRDIVSYLYRFHRNRQSG